MANGTSNGGVTAWVRWSIGVGLGAALTMGSGSIAWHMQQASITADHDARLKANAQRIEDVHLQDGKGIDGVSAQLTRMQSTLEHILEKMPR